MSQDESQMKSRRQFFKLAAGFSGLVFLAPKAVFAEEKRGAKPGAAPAGGDLALPYVEPGKGVAASLNFATKQADVKNAALKIDRGGVPFVQQGCGKCMLYAPVGKKDGGDVGKCSLFVGNIVRSTSWCASWTKKA